MSALLGRIPSAVGYQPTLATDLGGLQERITTTKKGSITSVQAIYVPADDLTDPAPATTFAHLDATTVLSRQVCEREKLNYFCFFQFFGVGNILSSYNIFFGVRSWILNRLVLLTVGLEFSFMITLEFISDLRSEDKFKTH